MGTAEESAHGIVYREDGGWQTTTRGRRAARAKRFRGHFRPLDGLTVAGQACLSGIPMIPRGATDKQIT